MRNETKNKDHLKMGLDDIINKEADERRNNINKQFNIMPNKSSQEIDNIEKRIVRPEKKVVKQLEITKNPDNTRKYSGGNAVD